MLVHQFHELLDDWLAWRYTALNLMRLVTELLSKLRMNRVTTQQGQTQVHVPVIQILVLYTSVVVVYSFYTTEARQQKHELSMHYSDRTPPRVVLTCVLR